MQGNSTRHLTLIRLAALALFTLCFAQLPVRGQHSGAHLLYQDVFIPSIGLAPGQILRLTLFNPNGTPVRAQARAYHSGGVNVALGDASVRFIRPGAFQSFDFNRSDIRLEGEAGTGRIQLSASIRLTFSEAINSVPVSMEIVEVQDGTSNTFLVGEKLRSQAGGSGDDFIISAFGNDTMIGIVPGQTLRVTLFNPPQVGPETQRNPVSGHVKIFDGSGGLIVQSPEQVIPPGEFRSIDFSRDALSIIGEPGTNRAQVRIRPFFTFESQRLSALPNDNQIMTSFISFEVIDNSTGKTKVLSGHECLVFFLGGIPND